MAQVTSGRVVYSRTVQPAQYESKRAEVELTFALAEGEELGAVLDNCAANVQAKVLEMVGLQPQQQLRQPQRQPGRGPQRQPRPQPQQIGQTWRDDPPF